MLRVEPNIEIPLREFQFAYARSSGPGGQNVNKVNSKVTLRWAVLRSPSIPGEVRTRFVDRFKRRMTKDGEVVVTSQRFRDQGRNVADCLEKLHAMIAEVAPRPKRRRKTRPTRGAVERRLRQKRRQSQKKDRRRVPDD